MDNEKDLIVYRGRYCFVKLSNPRLMPGHLLVIPIRHVEKLSELNVDESKEIFDALKKYSEKILKIAGGCSIHQNYMPMLPESNTKVSHLHIHLWPREFNDELYMKSMKHEHKLFMELTEKERKKYKKLFG